MTQGTMTDHERQELEPPAQTMRRGMKPSRQGEHLMQVRRIQEWLTLHGHATAIDGDYGPATEAAVRAIMPEDPLAGAVDAAVWDKLVYPLRGAISAGAGLPTSMATGEKVVVIARRHLAVRPREVGKPNGGPFVRLYCHGKEVPWCAGFATTVLRQALGHDKWYTLSCDELAMKAVGTAAFLRAPGPRERHLITPGSLFLLRRDERDWYHTGIVTRVELGGEAFHTAEGNTNAGGSPEGTAALARVRAFKDSTDFILVGGHGQ